MLHTYRYQVQVLHPATGQIMTYSGEYSNLHSEAEAIATLKRHYSNIVDYDVWEV